MTSAPPAADRQSTDPETAAPPVLPVPAQTRWQPLRIGLVDLFYYDTEEFWFRDGRLLLRGNNGTGKSKVLALTLPFLLDGDLSARRVEPDGDPGKRMEWNLLLGGEHPHTERLGYTWIEFGRRDESGRAHFTTLLCGLKAVSGRGIARHWFAVARGRITPGGVPDADGTPGLSLLDSTGTALTRDRLAEAIEGHGTVYDQARAYRRAVDESLFGLGERRYAALVDLLVQLRQPQLSKRPNEAALSRALTEALPPVDQALIADVAEAFRSLDEEKAELAATREAERAATGFLGHYRRYARVAARRRARLPRAEHSKYEHLQRDLAQAHQERTAAEEQSTVCTERLAALDEAAVRLQAEDEALRAGPEMRSAQELQNLAREAAAARTRAEAAEADRRRSVEDLDRAATRTTRASTALEAAQDHLDTLAGQAREAAAEACIAPDRTARTEGAPPAELRRAAEESVARSRRGIDHVTGLLAAAEHAERTRLDASRRLDDTETEHAASLARADDADRASADAGRELLDRVREYAASRTELVLPDPEGLLDRTQDWTGHLAGPSPVRADADTVHRSRTAHLAEQAATLAQRISELAVRRGEFRKELTRLEAGGQRGPTAPYSRAPGVRDTAPGAPLWRLVDFRDGVPAAHRAGLEAALEASGLLDAWVHPDGVVTSGGGRDAEGGHDTLIAADAAPVPGPALLSALRPAADHGDPRAAQVAEARVAQALAAIGLRAEPAAADPQAGPTATATAWVAPDGRFRLGPLAGSWHKPAAEYIGEGAREEARRARITAVQAELADLEQQSQALRIQAAEVAARRARLDAELAELPDDAPLRHAHLRAASAHEDAQRAAARKADAGTAHRAAAETAAEAAAEVAEAADTLALPADRPSLAAVTEALHTYELLLAALWPALRTRDDSARTLAEQRAEHQLAAERAEEHTRRAEDAARDAQTADARHTTLASTVGAAVADLQRRLADTERARTACTAEQRDVRKRQSDADKQAARHGGVAERLTQDIADAVAARAEAIASLQRFTTTGLLAVALPDADLPSDPAGEPWAPTPAIALARAVEAELTAVDDSEAAWERVQSRLAEEHKRLADALSPHGHRASTRLAEEVMVVDVVYQGRDRAVPELADALTAEAAELTRILSAHEREILETHLITEVAGTLQELMGAAERQVADMNRELEQRPTSTGMRLRLMWRPSRKAPSGLAAVRARLRQSADAWSPEQRAAVGEFLQAQIAAQAADDATGSWLDHLTAALDYRSWHEFGIERHQHGQWVPATGPASGGERVLAVSVPLFAAASSHYATAANPHAPRLVTLDEAFAGVDDDSRAKCLGLLTAFDLDVVMTSEREWACYPQVPGVAIAQLSRVDEVPAVLVTRWQWDGTRRTRGTEPA